VVTASTGPIAGKLGALAADRQFGAFVDFAPICATHRELCEAAEQGHFRGDLYYRINGLTVHLPALRERGDFLGMTECLLAGINPGRTPWRRA